MGQQQWGGGRGATTTAATNSCQVERTLQGQAQSGWPKGGRNGGKGRRTAVQRGLMTFVLL